MKRNREGGFETMETCLERETLLGELQIVVVKWNAYTRQNRCDMSMYNGIVSFCNGDIMKLKGYVNDILAAMGETELMENKNVLKRGFRKNGI